MPPRSLAEPELRKVLDALGAGVDRATAAQYVNLAPADFTALLEANPELRSAVESAEAASRVANIGAIARAARGGDWRAAAFQIEQAPSPAPTRAPFDPAKHCGGKTNDLNGGTPCTRIKGWGTPHRGFGTCRSHFGNSVTGKKHAATEAAAAALARLGRPRETDPKRALLEQVWEAAGNVAFLRDRVADMGTDLTLMSSDQVGGRLVIRDDVRAMVKLYNDERDRLAKIALMTINAGVSESLVAIARTTAESIAAVVNAVLEGLELPEEQRERGRAIAGTKLRLLSGRVA